MDEDGKPIPEQVRDEDHDDLILALLRDPEVSPLDMIVLAQTDVFW